MRKISLFFVVLLLSLFLIACSDNKVEEATSSNDAGVEEEVNEDQVDEEESSSLEEGEIDFQTVLEEIEEATDGEVEVLYENREAQLHEEDEYSISLDSYVVAEIEDFHADFASRFDSEDRGAILLSHFTIENKMSSPIAYTPNWSLQYQGADRFPGPDSYIIREELQIAKKLNANDFSIEPKESVSGYYAILLRTEDIENIENVNVAKLPIPEAGDEYLPDQYEYKNKIGSKTEFSIVVSEEGSSKQESDEIFYEDRTHIDNMGDKTMLKEKEGVDEAKTVGDIEVVLKGYQFTEFEPNEHEAPSFENFDTGIVLLNIKLEITNGEDDPIDLRSQKARLDVNDGKQYVLLANSLSPYFSKDEQVDAGETREAILVFALDKEQYDKVWKDKSFELEYGPFQTPELKDLAKGKTVEFTLPE